jgi:hypothetical protein
MIGKSVLIALAALTAFDAAAWQGYYRQATFAEGRSLYQWVSNQQWDSWLIGG